MRLVLVLAIALVGCSSSEEPPPATCDPAALTHSTVAVSGYDFHVTAQGCGAPVVLFHGFPEMAYAWEGIQQRLSTRFLVYAPDLRGVDLSEGPEDVDKYRAELLIEDGRAIVEAVAGGPAIVLGHDWGGIVAWGLGALEPEMVRKLVIVNAPHPDVFRELLATDAEQQMASSYMNFFITEGSEETIAANDYALFADLFADFLTDEQLARYREGWSRPGAMKRHLNWYRANFDPGPVPKPGGPEGFVVDVPTLVLWGMQDDAILAKNLDGIDEWVADLQIQELPDADHWVAHREPDALAEAIAAFAGE